MEKRQLLLIIFHTKFPCQQHKIKSQKKIGCQKQVKSAIKSQGMLIFWSSYGVAYNAPAVSATTFFTVLIAAAAAVLPFFLGLLTNDFWILSGTLYELPSVVFRKEAIVILSTASATGFIDPADPTKPGSNSMFWSSLPWINEFRGGVNRVPVFQVASVDENMDGLTDMFDISIQFPLFSSTETITKAQVVLFFDVEFRVSVR